MKPADYNYAIFPSEDDIEFFAAFFELLKPGEKAPDPELLDLESDESIPLSTITRQHAFTVIELGSLT
ncbi:hypothetical protein BH20CHL1_BH20CHL1_05930 [soil metagenome]|jgi:hypothetical protein|nr:hypothetical protein [Chloroflexia bacterium]